MSRRSRIRVGLAGGLAALLALGCSSDDPPDMQCPRQPAAFRVLLHAAVGPLPDDTLLAVRYGAGQEEFRLEAPPVEPEVVFCEVSARDGGVPGVADASAPPFEAAEAIACDLWTDGPAIVTVTASGYPELREQLEPLTDECGVKDTVEVELVLGDEDAGS